MSSFHFSLVHTASYCLTASSSLQGIAKASFVSALASSVVVDLRSSSSLQGIAKASFVSALASSVGSQSRCPHRQWSFHPLRFLNGLFTPFGSPVSRGTETFPGGQKPSKTDTLLSEIIRKSDKYRANERRTKLAWVIPSAADII